MAAIFQTWRDAPSVPPVCEEWVARVKACCSEWGFEYHLHDDRQILALVEEHFPELLERFLSWEKIIQIDLWRYLVVYHHGGYYLDVDCIPMPGFAQLPHLTDRPVLQIERNAFRPWFVGKRHITQIGQFFFGFPKGHPLLRRVIDEAVARLDQGTYRHLPRNEYILSSTGPYMFTQILWPSLQEAHVFPKDTAVDHQPMGTWRTPGTWPGRKPIQKRAYYRVKHLLLGPPKKW